MSCSMNTLGPCPRFWPHSPRKSATRYTGFCACGRHWHRPVIWRCPAMWCPRLFAELKPCPRRVELEDHQHDVVETESGKGIVEHQTRRLGAVTFAPVLGLADKDAESGRTVAVIYAVQTGVTYRLQPIAFVDSK